MATAFVQKLVAKGFLHKQGTHPFPHTPGVKLNKGKFAQRIEDLAEVVSAALEDGKLTPFELISIGQALAHVVVRSSDERAPGEEHPSRQFEGSGVYDAIEVVQDVVELIPAGDEAIQTIEGAAHASEDVLAQVEADVKELAGAHSPAEAIAHAGELLQDAVEVEHIVEEHAGPIAQAVSTVGDLLSGIVDKIEDIIEPSPEEAAQGFEGTGGEPEPELEPDPTEETPKKKRSRRS